MYRFLCCLGRLNLAAARVTPNSAAAELIVGAVSSSASSLSARASSSAIRLRSRRRFTARRTAIMAWIVAIVEPTVCRVCALRARRRRTAAPSFIFAIMSPKTEAPPVAGGDTSSSALALGDSLRSPPPSSASNSSPTWMVAVTFDGLPMAEREPRLPAVPERDTGERVADLRRRPLMALAKLRTLSRWRFNLARRRLARSSRRTTSDGYGAMTASSASCVRTKSSHAVRARTVADRRPWKKAPSPKNEPGPTVL
mmetsp:Transcript_5590/g.19984  ORF Transcript_5590/g.19984 Transcript_5590/m.19984 type:complete len:255 (-) Transcript_5590:3812-4576(-)